MPPRNPDIPARRGGIERGVHRHGQRRVAIELRFNTVLGLAINRFPAQGIVLSGVSNVIQGNFIGTDTTGTLARDNGSFGIWVKSLGNQIGGTTAAARNVISGGNNTGIYIYNTSSNVVQGNYIASAPRARTRWAITQRRRN